MSTSGSAVDVSPANSTASFSSPGIFSGRTEFNRRHELVDAQVEVLRMYLEKKPREELLEALDRLIERSRLAFREEEGLMQGYAPNPDPRHADLHQEVLAQMVLLREYAMDFDRTRVLAQLIVVDRKLTSHLLEGIEELESPA